MSLTGTVFLFFFLPVSLALFYISSDRVKEYVLLVISLVFYAVGSLDCLLLFIILLILSVVIGRLISRVSQRWIKRILLVSGILVNISALAYYKYANFAIEVFNDITGDSVETQKLLLPLGISFFTFKAISYLVDVYKKKVELAPSPVSDALYLSFFPQIQSGPLSRYGESRLDVSNIKTNLFSDGIYRFIIGFNKKVLLSNVLVSISNEVFSTSFDEFSVSMAWLGSICYSLQLFFDFAGYSDMAIGLSEMFGFKCTENFNYPYMTESFAQFWRRWHISLGAWFRDYVYIPMGGSRNKNKYRVYLNLLVVWLLTGIWHGASWNFIVWGLGYFILISLERLTKMPERLHSRVLKVLYRIGVLFVINILWIFFRAKNLTSALKFSKRLFICESGKLANRRVIFLLKDYWAFILFAIILCFPIIPWIEKKVKKKDGLYKAYQFIYALVLILLFIWAFSFVASGQTNPFTYANF